MKEILIKDGDTLIERHVFSGNLSIVEVKAAQFREQFPDYTVSVNEITEG